MAVRDAEIEGRRSFIAGIMSSVAASIVVAVGPSTPVLLPVFFLLGLVMAVLMFFAWLTPTPERMPDRPAIEP